MKISVSRFVHVWWIDNVMIWRPVAAPDHFRPLLPENGLQEIILTIAVAINGVTAFTFNLHLHNTYMYRANSRSVDLKRHSNQRYRTQVEQSNLNNLFSHKPISSASCPPPYCHLAYHGILVVNSSDTVFAPCATLNCKETLRRNMNCLKARSMEGVTRGSVEW